MNKPKKSLGQNFLHDEGVLEKIIASANLKLDDFVIEIGPGKGVLSAKLKKKAKKLIMIEKDGVLAKKMAYNFQFSVFSFQKISNDLILTFKNKGAIIIGDILKINLSKLIKNNFQNKKYKLIANIPYYITSPIIQLFLETHYPPQEMILMVQREVAERICAHPGQMSILAISVQYYAKPELLFYVDKKSFFPIPKVDSAVIKISKIHRRNRGSLASTMEAKLPEKLPETKHFFHIVKTGFSAKRKTLINNFSASLQLDKKEVKEKLKKVGITPTQRAQELSIKDWKKLSKILKE